MARTRRPENRDNNLYARRLRSYARNRQDNQPAQAVLNLVDLDPTLDDTSIRMRDYRRTLQEVFLCNLLTRNSIREEVCQCLHYYSFLQLLIIQSP